MKTSTKLTDTELLTRYRDVNTKLAKIPGYEMSLEKAHLENEQENLIREGQDRGIIG